MRWIEECLLLFELEELWNQVNLLGEGLTILLEIRGIDLNYM